jgi:hypothetical protein
MTQWSDAFSTGKATLYLTVTETSIDAPTNTSVVSFTLSATGNNASYNLNSGSTWSISINGTPYSGSWTYDFRADNTKTIKATTTQSVVHDADGSKTITVSATAYGLSTIGTATITAKSLVLTNHTRVPNAPAAPTLALNSANPMAIDITSAIPADLTPAGPALDDYNYQYSTDNATWSGAQGMGTDRTETFTSTTPGLYYIQTRAHSSEGWGGWSSSSSITTFSGGKVWNGTAFVPGTAKVWNGTAWVIAVAKVWNGSAWTNAK